MNATSPEIKTNPKQVKDYISVIENAVEIYELYTVNIQLEILKINLLEKDF